MAELERYLMLIDGDWVGSSDGVFFESIDPSTGVAWAEVPEATESDVDLAVSSALRAFESGVWSGLTATERGRILRRVGDLLVERSEELGAIETRDTGKMFAETRFQARYIAEYFYFYGGCADKISGETLPIDRGDSFVFTAREPLGVVAAIVPWNSQLFLSAVKLGPALAAGNTVVMKASEHASAPLLALGGLLMDAGIPSGVVNIVTGHGEPCGDALTRHGDISRISFTGGVDSARCVVRNSAENFAEVSLELGGKSPLIVFDDADIGRALEGVISGIFGASGQSCVASSRLYLHESIADDFLERLSIRVSDLVIGAPMSEVTDMGPLCTLDQLLRIEEHLALSVSEGATIRCGGVRFEGFGGYYFEPTVVECPRHDMSIVGAELFGPVLCVFRFRDESEVLSLANDSVYGLAAGIFTCDIGRSLRISRGLRCGIVWVNSYRLISPIAEFGGMKDSGYGREGGLQAVYDYTRTKTVWLNTSSGDE